MQHGRIRVALFGSHGESRKCRGGTGAQADSRAPGVRPQQREAIAMPFDIAAALLMLTQLLVGAFYCLDPLHGERRDRSILFWKSLPVSDLTTVLSKASIPLVVLPLLTFTITVAMQL